MTKPPEKTIHWSGSAPDAIGWRTLVEIFDALFGESHQDLPEWPKVIGHTTARWADGTGVTYKLDHLDDLKEPYDPDSGWRSALCAGLGREISLTPPSADKLAFADFTEA
jgi:hypothetical protein